MGVMSASARYHTGPWQLSVSVNNLLDRAYCFPTAQSRQDAAPTGIRLRL